MVPRALTTWTQACRCRSLHESGPRGITRRRCNAERPFIRSVRTSTVSIPRNIHIVARYYHAGMRLGGMSTECNNPDTFAIRLANATDAATLASLFQLVYRNSSHPLQNLDDVARFLRNVLNLCVVADVDGRIVASMAMTHCPWNDSYECGRALTDPEWRRQGVAPLLMHRVLGEIRECGMGQVYYGYPRVRRIAELAETVIPAFVVTGHDGGRNVANGARETHLIMCAVPSHARFEHVAPDPFGRTAFVQEEIYRPLGLAGRVGSYPPFCFVGDPAAAMLSVGDFLVGYNPTSAHRGIEILGHQLTGTPAAD